MLSVAERFFINFAKLSYIVGNKAKGRMSKQVCVLWGKKCLFFGKFDVLCFLETPVLDLSFCLIADDI